MRNLSIFLALVGCFSLNFSLSATNYQSCKKQFTQKSLEETLVEKLQASPKSKKLHLDISFARKIIELLRNIDFESTPLPTLMKTITTKCLNEVGRGDVLQDNNATTMLIQVLIKWHSESWREEETRPPNWKQFAGKGQSKALTYKILNEYELEQWLNRRGDFAKYDHVAAYISIDLINRTQDTITDFVKDLDGNVIPFGTLVENMRRGGFDGLGAPDVVPVSRGRFATFAHRRLVAAKLAKIKKVLVKIHRPEAIVPNEPFSNSVANKINGYRPKTWGEAVHCLCTNTQNSGVPNFPIDGAPGLPAPPQSYFFR